MNPLFEVVPMEQLLPRWKRIAEELAAEGLRFTAVRYKPTGVVDIVVHQTKRPRAGVLKAMAELHLQEMDTGGAQ